jgi:hypothetical protein
LNFPDLTPGIAAEEPSTTTLRSGSSPYAKQASVHGFGQPARTIGKGRHSGRHVKSAFTEVPIERKRGTHAQPVHGFKARAVGQAQALVGKPGHLLQGTRHQAGVHENDFIARAVQQAIGDGDSD